MILRDAFHGLSKFDEFQRSLAVSPSILTRRPKYLVGQDILCRRAYQTRPVRYDYLLTDRGRAFFPVMMTLLPWGNQQIIPGEPLVVLVDRTSGQPVSPLLVDRQSLRPLTLENVALMAGPGDETGMQERLAAARRQTTHYANDSPEERL